MQIDYDKHIAPLLAKGNTVEQIAAILLTLRTHPTFVSDIESRIVPWGLLKRNPQGTVHGPLSDAANAVEDSALKRTAELFFSWLGSARAQTIRTNDVDIAPIWATGLGVLVGASLLTEAQGQELLTLSGHNMYPGVIDADVQSAIDAHTAQVTAAAAEQAAAEARKTISELWTPIYNRHIAAVLNGAPTLETLLTAVAAAHDELSVIVQG